jgi:hypothetical protein
MPTKICEAHFGDLEHPVMSDGEPIRIISHVVPYVIFAYHNLSGISMAKQVA